MSGIIADTCIFVDFLRRKGLVPELRELVQTEKIILSNFVRLELVNGAAMDAQLSLRSLLSGFRAVGVPVDFYRTVELTMPVIKRAGMNIGLIDLFIANQAKYFDLMLWTTDKQLIRAAKVLKTRLYAG